MLAILIKKNRHHNNRPDSNLLPECRYVQQIASVTHYTHNKRADESADNGSLSAGEAGATDDTGGDNIQFITGSGCGLSCAEP